MLLKEYLKENRIYQREMAEAVGVTQPYLQSVLAGRRRASSRLAERIEIATEGEVSAVEVLYPERFEITEDDEHEPE